MAVEAMDALSDVLPTQPVSAISSNTRVIAGHQRGIMGSLGTMAVSQILSHFCSPFWSFIFFCTIEAKVLIGREEELLPVEKSFLIWGKCQISARWPGGCCAGR